jgi:hypothetical protein
MTACEPGPIVLVHSLFTDLRSTRKRPVSILLAEYWD